MANQKHLALLRKGTRVWNEWRQKNPGIKPDLTKADLTCLEIPGVNLREAELSDAEIGRVDLSQADLSKANLSNTNFHIDNLPTNLIRANLSDANLSGTDLSEACLVGANFERANLSNVDLVKTNMSRANFYCADLRGAYLFGANLHLANLQQSDLSKAYLCGANLSEANLTGANLTETKLRKANLNDLNLIRKVNLSRAKTNCYKTSIPLNEYLSRGQPHIPANLTDAVLDHVIFIKANLTETNFVRAKLTHADLSNANLTRVQALKASFENATLTGACIEDWNVNSETNLKNITCDYIYLKQNQQERRPYGLNFALGEFATLFQVAVETVDLIFSNGINWQAFLSSFQKLQIKFSSDELAVKAIERKSGSAFVIRVEVPPDVNKAQIEKTFKREYEQEVKNLEEKYLLQLNAEQEKTEIYREQIQSLRQDKICLLDVIETMAKKDNSKVNMNFNAPVTGATGNVEGDQTIYASEPEKTNPQKTETQSEEKNLWTWFVKFLSIGQGTQFVIIILGLLAGIITVFFSPSDFPFFKPDTEQTIQEQSLN